MKATNTRTRSALYQPTKTIASMRDQSAAPTADLELRQAMSVEAKKLMVDSTYTSRGNLEAAER
jgi:hypothetical protein